jgi:hypothetical protein
MTTNPTPDFNIDPVVLADSIPLRRVGTPEVWRISVAKLCTLLMQSHGEGHGRCDYIFGESCWCLCERCRLDGGWWSDRQCRKQLLGPRDKIITYK